MPERFVIDDETTHVVGDAPCPECLEEYRSSARAGG